MIVSEIDLKEVALGFIHKYAMDHQFFTGGDILVAFKQSGLPGASDSWRNRWGALVVAGSKNDWYVKVGRVTPTSRQSHTNSLVQWQSRLFKGEQALTAVTVKSRLEELRKKVVLREMSVIEALWAAYELDRDGS